MDRLVITRETAKAAGLSRYFTGCPCKYGHICDRYVYDWGCWACKKVQQKKWRVSHPKGRVEIERRSHAKRGQSIEYQQRKRAAFRNYSARKLKAEGKHTAGDVRSMFVSQRGLCLCGADLTLGFHVDHKRPLSRGGSNWPENLQLLCPFCNTSKGAKTMEEWLCREVAA